MTLSDFMENNFQDLVLYPPLFYSWDIGIRFELGDPEISSVQDPQYIPQVYDRALELYRALHHQDDDLFVVTTAYFAHVPKHQAKKLNLYKRYIKDKQILKKLRLEVVPDIGVDPGEVPDPKKDTYIYWIKCKSHEVNSYQIIKAICNHEVGLKPRIWQRVYFINIKNKTIFHIYDDRGCDVISASKNSLAQLYTNYNDWILDYDREMIDQVFR